MFSREQLVEILNKLQRYDTREGFYGPEMIEDNDGPYLTLEDIAIEFGLELEYGDYGKFKIDEQLKENINED